MWTHLANGCSVADWDAMEMRIYSRERCKWQFRWCTKRCWLRKLQRFIANKLKLHEGWSETNQEIFIFNIIHHFHTPLLNFQFQCLTSNEVLILCSVKSSCRVTRFLFFYTFFNIFLVSSHLAMPATIRNQIAGVSQTPYRPHQHNRTVPSCDGNTTADETETISPNVCIQSVPSCHTDTQFVMEWITAQQTTKIKTRTKTLRDGSKSRWSEG